MRVTLTIGESADDSLVLAGSSYAGASGLRLAVDAGAWQVEPMLRAKEPRVYDRGNRLVTVSFRARALFGTPLEAEAHIIALPARLQDQRFITAELMQDDEGPPITTLYQVAADVAASQRGCTVDYDVTLRGRLTDQNAEGGGAPPPAGP